MSNNEEKDYAEAYRLASASPDHRTPYRANFYQAMDGLEKAQEVIRLQKEEIERYKGIADKALALLDKLSKLEE